MEEDCKPAIPIARSSSLLARNRNAAPTNSNLGRVENFREENPSQFQDFCRSRVLIFYFVHCWNRLATVVNIQAFNNEAVSTMNKVDSNLQEQDW